MLIPLRIPLHEEVVKTILLAVPVISVGSLRVHDFETVKTFT